MGNFIVYTKDEHSYTVVTSTENGLSTHTSMSLDNCIKFAGKYSESEANHVKNTVNRRDPSKNYQVMKIDD